jgi:hypothetical protein
MATQLEIKTFKNLPVQCLIDLPSNIPWIIQLFENPRSPFALPGKITLYNHDCLHVLLERGVAPEDEAFVIGFTMGNDPKTHWFHLLIYKILASFFYPAKYQFNRQHWTSFDLGFLCGKKLSPKYTNINLFDFSYYQNSSIEELRGDFGIRMEDLKMIYQFEQWLLS